MRVRTVLLTLVGLVVLAVAAVVVFVLTIDPNDYRADIQQSVEDATGRKLTLGGDLSMGISLTPSIVAREITLANASWGTKPDMIKADQLDVEVELIPLLSGQIHIIRLVLNGADVLLETNSDGVGNWKFGDAAKADSGSDEQMLLTSVDSVEIENATFTFLNGETGVSHDVKLDTVSLSTDGPSSALNVDIKASSAGSPITISGAAGSPDALMRSGTGPVDLTVNAFGIDATLKGTVSDVAAGGTVDLDFTVASDSLGNAAQAAGMTAPIAGPVKFDGHIKGTSEKFELSGLTAEAANIKTDGDLTVDLTGARPSLTGKLALGSLDLTALSGAGDTSGGASDKVFSSDPLPVGLLRLVDADVELKIATLTTAFMVAENVVLPIKLSGGNLQIDPVTAKVASSDLTSTLGLDAANDAAKMTLKLTAKGLDVGKMLKDADVTEMLSGKGDLSVDVNGQGASVAAIMAALNGEASLLMEDGDLDVGGLKLLMGGTNALLGAMFAGDAKAATMSCLAVDYDIKDGIADQKVLLIDTQYAVLIGQGKIDLGKETIDLVITPRAKGVSLNVNVPVRVGGTLAAPTFQPDEAALAMKIGTLVGGSFFPPALLLSLGDLGGATDHGCQAANTGQGVTDTGILGGAASTVEGASDTVDDVVDDIGQGIENLLGD